MVAEDLPPAPDNAKIFLGLNLRVEGLSHAARALFDHLRGEVELMGILIHLRLKYQKLRVIKVSARKDLIDHPIHVIAALHQILQDRLKTIVLGAGVQRLGDRRHFG